MDRPEAVAHGHRSTVLEPFDAQVGVSDRFHLVGGDISHVETLVKVVNEFFIKL